MHFAIIDTIDGTNDAALGKEQDILDECDDEISVRLQKLITACSTIADPDVQKRFHLENFMFRQVSPLQN